MAARSLNRGRIIRGICLGLAATLLMAGAYSAGVGKRAELWILDIRFRNLPTVAPRDDVVHIDIDDKSLEQIGRWPWPRRRLGQLVEALNACGARAVVLDIILPDPQEPRYVKQGHTDLYQAETGEILIDAPPLPVLDDVEFSQVLSAGPNIFLAMHVDIATRSGKTSNRRHEDLISLITTRPAETPARAAAETGMKTDEVITIIPAVKQQVYERRINALLRDRAELSFKTAIEKLFGPDKPGSKDFDIARQVYLRQRAQVELKRFALPESAVSIGTFPGGRAVPPLVTMAKAMAHTGFVTITPDDDGVIRRVPLLAKTGSGVFVQLATVLSAEILAADHGGGYTISAGDEKVNITCSDGFVREVPVDSDGYMLINWSLDNPDRRVARHIPAVAAAGLWQATEAMQQNSNLMEYACVEIINALKDPKKGDTEYKDLRNLFDRAGDLGKQIRQRQWRRHVALLFTPAQVPPKPDKLIASEKMLERKIERRCAELIRELDEFYLPSAGQVDAGGESEQLQQLRRWRKMIRLIERERPRLQKRLDDAKRRLRKEVEGRICLIGSTATGAADFIPTPVHKRTPGVVMHANILNTILSGKFVRAPGTWASVLLILLAGMLVALVTSTRGPIESAIVLAAAIAGFIFILATAWKGWTCWIVAVAPIATMLLVFTVVTVYRQLTEQRQRRQITSTFKQYLSPAMVDELVHDPSQASLGGQSRQLSCLFSDLAGFTSMSEHLGPEGTVALLNRYLDRVGDILQGRYGGTLSKYEGDGIFAFFGAPIPQDDHAERAILSAMDCQAFLPEFNRSLQDEHLLPDEAELSARIGITAGEVFVGNMGSTQRIAYTAIGDAVNLASRLETANKFFGTAILVNEQAWRSVADELTGRPMGKILVVGKTEPVEVWEPLARKDGADGRLRKFAVDFARGVELYAAGDFKAAREKFQTVLADRDDRPARLYLQLCDQGPNQPDFDGVIRLTEK